MAQKESFNLRLLFEGVCAWVPDQPFFKEDADGAYAPGKPTMVTVLLPDRRRMRLADWEMRGDSKRVDRPSHMAAHTPVFTVWAKDVAGNKPPQGWTDATLIDPGTGRQRLLHVLDNQLISLRLDPWPKLRFVDDIPHDQGQKLPKKDDRSLWWMPRMSEISPPDQWCDPSYLGDLSPFDLKKMDIAARLELKGGALSVDSFNGLKKPNWWSFGWAKRDRKGKLSTQKRGSLTWNKAIGNRIACDIEVPGSSIEIDFQFKNKKNDVFPLVLAPSEAGEAVEVVIANAELEDLMLNAPPTRVWGQPSLPDADFQAFYSLTRPAGSPRKTRRPGPVPIAPNGTEVGLTGEKPCASSVMNRREK
jgi:hypothetical protein